MEIKQISNNNQMNQSPLIAKDKNIENKVKAIMSQLPGKVKNISYNYDQQSISKAKITIVVSSKEEAEKVKQSIDDEIDIKVIIQKEVKTEESISDLPIQKKQQNPLNNSEVPKDFSANIYSYTRGPEGKIYGIIKEENDDSTNEFINSSIDKKTNYNLRDKYIKIYKRYNFKNVVIKENQDSNNFSLNI
ncbi:MAG TPA: hypothetical protein VJ962_07280 [Clostridia bacterium]|nr:hypothetical protein [Clostridia bacterium]